MSFTCNLIGPHSPDFLERNGDSYSNSCYNPFTSLHAVTMQIYTKSVEIFWGSPQVHPVSNKTQFLKDFLETNRGPFTDFSQLGDTIFLIQNQPFASLNELADEWKSLEIEYLEKLQADSFLELKQAALSQNSPFRVFQNQEARLLATLDTLTSHFGYQARLPECAHDIAPADFDMDRDLKEVIEKNEGTGAYKITSLKNLEQLLTKIPAAFISAGLNPDQVRQLKELEENPGQADFEEKRSALIKIQTDNYQQLKDDLASAGLKLVEVDGKYGGEEKSFMVILDHKLKVGSFKAFLNNDKVKNLIALGKKYNQDSVLFQWGAAQFYYYPDNDKISFGEGYEVYDLNTKNDEESLPESATDYYSDIKKDGTGKLRFQLRIDFDHRFSPHLFGSLCDYAKTQFFKDYYLSGTPVNVAVPTKKQRFFVIMRGVDNYNEAGIRLYRELKAQNISAAIFGSDAHLHALEREGVKGFNNLLPLMRERNKRAFDTLLKTAGISVIIFADMNKMLAYFEPYIEEALQAGIEKDDILIWNVQERNMENPLQRCLFSHTVRHKMQIEQLKAAVIGNNNIPQIIDTKETDNLPLIHNRIITKLGPIRH